MYGVAIFALALVAVITSILGLLAILQQRRDPVAWACAAMMFASAGWSGGIALFYAMGSSPNAANWAVSTYYIAAAFIALAFLYLVLNIASKLRTIRRYVYVITAIPFLMVAAGFIFLPDVFIQEVQPGSVTLQPAGYLVYCLYFIGYYGAALFVLGWVVRHSHGIARTRLRYLLVGYFIGGVIGATFNLILPALGTYELIALGPLGLFVFVPMAYVTIVKYGLFDVRRAVARSIAYISTFVVIGASYAFIITLLSSQFGNVIIVQTAIILVAAVAFQPMRRFFDKITNQLFYRDASDVDTFYKDLNRILSATRDLRTLINRASGYMLATLKSDAASFSVYYENRLVAGGLPKAINIPLDDVRRLDAYAFKNAGIIQTDHIDDREVRRLLVSHRVCLALPLRYERIIIGYVLLGAHKGSGYTSRDLKTLETIADELAIAVQNALSVHAVKEVNDHLEQRIDAATKELRASNAQLQKLDEAKDEFISMASHQLRTPLTSIKGYISMLLEGDVGQVSRDQKQLLNEVFISSERMVRLIGDFLNVSRLQTGKFVIEKHPVDMALLVRRELDGLASNAAARRITFAYSMPKNIPLMQLDENKIQQVVMNFADNAIYYSKEAGTITVKLKKVAAHTEPGKHATEEIEFTVKDTGIGVPKAEQAQLFSKFFRATNARKARPDGTGVGLFLARRVIEDHGGTIIFSSHEGKGSTFGFRLPIEPTDREAER